ncbi:NADPH-dependent F420 reductase, partial [Microbacterium sp.]
MTRVGIIGAGHIGSALARGLVAQGHEVAISNSRGPETLGDLVAELGPSAQAMTATDAAAFGDWAIVTIPLKAIDTLPVDELAGKIVVDTNNYYWERDGHIAVLDEKQTTTSELLQERLPESTVVKGFNHIMASQ